MTKTTLLPSSPLGISIEPPAIRMDHDAGRFAITVIGEVLKPSDYLPPLPPLAAFSGDFAWWSEADSETDTSFLVRSRCLHHYGGEHGQERPSDDWIRVAPPAASSTFNRETVERYSPRSVYVAGFLEPCIDDPVVRWELTAVCVELHSAEMMNAGGLNEDQPMGARGPRPIIGSPAWTWQRFEGRIENVRDEEELVRIALTVTAAPHPDIPIGENVEVEIHSTTLQSWREVGCSRVGDQVWVLTEQHVEAESIAPKRHPMLLQVLRLDDLTAVWDRCESG